MSGGFKASIIPNNVKKTIQTIKEITGNHSDEEIYSMLKECGMDPNETTQKLLLQDTFHEVKRRRDRKKENPINRDTSDLRWRLGGQGRGGRGGRGNYTSRHAPQDGGGHAKENGIIQASNKVSSPSLSTFQDTKKKVNDSSVTEMPNGEFSSRRVAKEPRLQSRSSESKRSDMMSGTNVDPTNPVGIQASDPKLVTSNNSRGPVDIGSIKRDIGSQRSFSELNSNLSLDNKSNAGKGGSKSQGVGKNHSVEVQSSWSSHGSSSSSRPSSNYGSRSQQALGSQKAGPNKEWKPKATNTISVQEVKTPVVSEGSTLTVETSAQTRSVENISDSECAIAKCQKELEGLNVRDAQHVIIPNHIHVPDAVRTGLSFGSFDATFVISSNRSSKSEMKNSSSVSQVDQGIEETVEEASSQNMFAHEEEAEYVDQSQSPKQVVNLSTSDDNVPPSSVPSLSDSKETENGPQDSSIQSSSGYNFGLLPPMLGNPLGSLEASETQVQPPVDPSSFYAQFYRSSTDSDGGVSSFPEHTVASKYNENGPVLSSQTPQSISEGGNSLVMTTSSQTSITTPTTGVILNSRAVTPQPMPIFRQPTVHIPHYPPNYIPYGHYFPPFYVPPPGMHQFLGNITFPQQAQPSSGYSVQPAPSGGPPQVKFPMSQYKPGGNMGMGAGYGPYAGSPGGYNPSSAGNSSGNEDLTASQFKENNLYITGQQSEGSAVWIPAPGRDIINLPPNSFYNIAPQGQHVTFTPTQAGQGTFAGIYHPHPAQSVTGGPTIHPLLQQSQPMPLPMPIPIPGGVDMVGPTPNVYQNPQHTQINWPNNY